MSHRTLLYLLLLVPLACGDDAAAPDASPGDAGTPDAAALDAAPGTDGAAVDGAVGPDAGPGTTTTIRVHYDTGMGNRIGLRGSAAPLDWNATVDTTWTQGNVWTYATTEITAPTELKPVFVDGADVMTWARGANWVVHPGETLDVFPFFFADAGTVESFTISTAALGDRPVEVYLPPSYDEPGAAGREYPVLVMQDGQNLFDPDAFFGGWAVDEALDGLLVGDAAGGVLDVIIVAPHNGGLTRIYEYTPNDGETDYCVASTDCGGAEVYLDFVEGELLPDVRTRYRAAPGRVGIAGSSLGGLVSIYACWTRPAAFDRCGVFSPSLWWDTNWMIHQVESDPGPKRDLLLYLDAGTVSDELANVIALVTDLTTKPGGLAYAVGIDLLCLQGVGHQHNEVAWRTRAPWALEWLYADPTRVQPAPPRPADVLPCEL